MDISCHIVVSIQLLCRFEVLKNSLVLIVFLGFNTTSVSVRDGLQALTTAFNTVSIQLLCRFENFYDAIGNKEEAVSIQLLCRFEFVS